MTPELVNAGHIYVILTGYVTLADHVGMTGVYALVLVEIFFRPQTFYSWSCAHSPSANEMVRDLVYVQEPGVVLRKVKLCVTNLVSDRQPPILNVAICPEQFNAFSSKTKSLDNVVYLRRLS